MIFLSGIFVPFNPSDSILAIPAIGSTGLVSLPAMHYCAVYFIVSYNAVDRSMKRLHGRLLSVGVPCLYSRMYVCMYIHTCHVLYHPFRPEL